MLPVIANNDNVTDEDRKKRRATRLSAYDKIEKVVNSATTKPVADSIAVSIIQTFTEDLKKNDSSLIENLIDEEKKLFEDLIKSVTSIQGKTLEEVSKKLQDAIKGLEKLSATGEASGNKQLVDFSNDQKEKLYDQLYKAHGIDKDPTLRERIKEKFVGTPTNPDGTTRGWVQGTSVLRQGASNFSQGFKETFFGGVLKTNEDRRAELRARMDYENKQLAAKEISTETLGNILNPTATTDTYTQGGGEETWQPGSANIAPDTTTKSDLQELKAGGRDTDATFSRSSTQADIEDHWKKLLDLLEDIKKCVCECQCSGGGMDLPIPMPVPTKTPSATRVPTRVPTSVPVAITERTRIPTAIPVSTPALETTRVARPMALPAPAAVEAQGLARQISQTRTSPALGYSPNNGVPLNFETPVREKVPVQAKIEPRTPAQRFYAGEITAEQAAKEVKAERTRAVAEGSQTRGAPTETRTVGRAERTSNTAPRVEPEVAAARERARDSYRPGETREQWTARRRANASEDALQRRLWEQNQKDNWNRARNGFSPSDRPLPANRAPVPATTPANRAPVPATTPANRAPVPATTPANRAPVPATTPVKNMPWYRRAWENVKSRGTSVAEAVKSRGSRVVATARPLLSRAANFVVSKPLGAVGALLESSPTAANDDMRQYHRGTPEQKADFERRQQAFQQEQQRKYGTNRNQLPVAVNDNPRPRAEPVSNRPWYSRAWEATKSGAGRAWEATKSGTGRVLGRAKEIGSGAMDRIRNFGQSYRTWGENSRLGRGITRVADSGFGREVGRVASNPITQGAVKWGGRALGALGVGFDVYNRRKEGQSWGKTAVGVGGSLGGAAAGAAAGAAIGSVVPVVGTAIGGLVGGAIGYWGGGKVADTAYDRVVGTAQPAPRRPVSQAPAAQPQANTRMPPATIASRNGAGEANRNPLAARVQSGQNEDSSIISRSTAAVATARGVAERPIINVPPPTVIQPTPGNDGMPAMVTPHTARPNDSSWLEWQKRRASFAA